MLECFEYNQHFVAMMNVINRAKRENLEGKFEVHHIIPRCFYKAMNMEVDNSDKNLVKLTREQHCKVHHLAMLCAKEIVKNSLTKAFQLMTHAKGRLGYKHDEETKQKISLSMLGEKNPAFGTSFNRGRKLSDETREKMSKAKIGKTRTCPNKGKHWTLINGKRIYFTNEV